MSNLEDLKLLVESIENQDVILINMRSKPSGKHNTKYTIVISDKESKKEESKKDTNNKPTKKHSKKEKVILEPKQPKGPVAPPRIGLAEITPIGTV